MFYPKYLCFLQHDFVIGAIRQVVGPVYKVSCEECEATYVGETECSLKARFGQHRRPSSTTSEVSKIYIWIAPTTTSGYNLLVVWNNIIKERLQKKGPRTTTGGGPGLRNFLSIPDRLQHHLEMTSHLQRLQRQPKAHISLIMCNLIINFIISD